MIKVGIIGCGKISEVRHVPEYAENPNAEIVGYYDYCIEKAEALAEKFGGKVFDSVEELLKSGVDAVSVCVANAEHASISIEALNMGVHVLCEKPMAITLQECETMNNAAKTAKKMLMIGHNQRLTKTHTKAQQLIINGEIGQVISFRTTFGHPGPEGWTGEKNSWFFDKARAAFGAMADLGVHKTDLIHYLLKDTITEVSAKIATLDKKYPDGNPVSVDDNAYCIYTTSRGVVGTMHVSWTFYTEEDNSTVVYGSEGVLRCYDNPKYSLIMEKKDGSKVLYSLDQMTSNKEQTSGAHVNTRVIDTFIESIQAGVPSVLSGEEAIKAMKVIFAAEESAQKGETIKVK